MTRGPRVFKNDQYINIAFSMKRIDFICGFYKLYIVSLDKSMLRYLSKVGDNKEIRF